MRKIIEALTKKWFSYKKIHLAFGELDGNLGTLCPLAPRITASCFESVFRTQKKGCLRRSRVAYIHAEDTVTYHPEGLRIYLCLGLSTHVFAGCCFKVEDILYNTPLRFVPSEFFGNGVCGVNGISFSLLQNAIAKLIRSNELELAVSVCRIVPDSKDLLEISTLLLSKRCEKFGKWYVSTWCNFI